ncbi:acyl carrier protein [Clostridium cylindrosporum]|uniref:Acyl carrier protein n=1 Tax=Clostridium cylindrosporum DSM 605 TaxID=1121307 RepID=A0A0J8D6J8_CLOCY|nr:acyl carrier protein [Clostridium cylindrosporum]KMT21477.1 acyl carrier protein AcpP [Clostridium cylindrosporum DSM 605]
MLFDKIKEKISEVLGVEADDVTMESTFIDDLGADSIDLVELVMALEEEFEIQIPDEEVAKIKSVSDVVEYIKENANI